MQKYTQWGFCYALGPKFTNNNIALFDRPYLEHVFYPVLNECSSTAAEGPNFRGTLTGATTFVHMSRIVPRGF